MDIRLRRHPIKFYLTLLFLFAFCCYLSAIGILIFCRDSNSERVPVQYLLLIVALFAIGMAIYVLPFFFRNAPIVSVSEGVLRLHGNSYSVAGVKSVSLTGKKPIKGFFGSPAEGMSITFEDGSKVYLFDDFYTNLWKLKSYIAKEVLKETTAGAVMTSSMHNEIEPRTFKGNPFLTVWSIMLVFFFVIMTFFMTNMFNDGRLNFQWVFLSILATTMTYLFSWFFHFFRIEKDTLIVRNHFLLWQKKTYPLDEIREITLGAQGNLPESMQIITNDFKRRIYPAASLKKKDWMEMRTVLKSRGVDVWNKI